MALRRLTDLAVRNARPKAKAYEISDAGQRGLRLAVFPSGVKSWVVRYRHPVSGVSRKMTLPFVGLAQARKLAADALYQIAQGVDPVDQKRADKQARIEASEGTIAAVAKRYLDIAASKLRSRDFYKSILDRHVLPKLGHRPVGDLRRTEIVAVLDHIERASGARSADMALAVVRSMLHWHEGRSDTFRSPVVRGMQRVKPAEHARTRSLDDDELRTVWQAAGDPRVGVYGQMIRFMCLTGARRAEAVGLRRSEVQTIRDNGDNIVVWRLPPSRSKTKREVVRPLSRAALDLIDAMPTIGHDDSGPVFTFSGHKSMAASRMDKKTLIDEISRVSDWRTHDLRRTFRTLLSRCRVPFEIAERCLGHAQNLLVKTYDQHSHLPAMQEAVEKVAAEIERIVAGEKTGKVIRLRS